jgi:hypothetical protein
MGRLLHVGAFAQIGLSMGAGLLCSTYDARVGRLCCARSPSPLRENSQHCHIRLPDSHEEHVKERGHGQRFDAYCQQGAPDDLVCVVGESYAQLTPREREVVAYVVAGLLNK